MPGMDFILHNAIIYKWTVFFALSFATHPSSLWTQNLSVHSYKCDDTCSWTIVQTEKLYSLVFLWITLLANVWGILWSVLVTRRCLPALVLFQRDLDTDTSRSRERSTFPRSSKVYHLKSYLLVSSHIGHQDVARRLVWLSYCNNGSLLGLSSASIPLSLSLIGFKTVLLAVGLGR